MLKKKFEAFIHSKYFYRRMAIIIASFLIIYVLIKATGLIISAFGPSGDAVVIETGEQATTDHATAAEETSGLTDSDDASTEPNTEETSEGTENTENTTESTTEATTEAKTEPTTVAPTEAVKKDFSKVSFHIQRFNYRYVDYALSNQSLSEREVVLAVNMNLDFPFYHYIENIANQSAINVLCNKYYQLSSDFTPNDLVEVQSSYHVSDGKEYKLRKEAYDAFKDMADAASKEGLSLKIVSAYRSNTFQANLYNKYVAANGKEEADRFSARPGHSEHETGLAIDINDVSQAFEKTDEFKWLSDNAHLYGYILRYPKGKEHLTGYMYEPWHYRYLGIDLATKVKTSGLTYDAYYAMVILK